MKSRLWFAASLLSCSTALHAADNQAALNSANAEGASALKLDLRLPTKSEPRVRGASKNATDDQVALNFANVDVATVLRLASQLTGKHFVVDPRVHGSVNIVSAEPISKELIYPTLVAALRLQGIAAIDDGTTVRIVPEGEARGQGVPLTGKPPAGDSLVTRVFSLRHESAVALATAVKPLLNANASVVGYAGNNTLVVTDFASNLTRLEKVLNSIDVPSLDQSQIVPLRFVSAGEIAGLVQSLIGETPGASTAAPGASTAAPGTTAAPSAGERFTALAEPRSNSLLLRTNNPDRMRRAQQLIQQLDRPEAGGNIEVIYLKNAVASEVAQTLRAVLSSENAGAGSASSAGNTAPAGDNNTAQVQQGRSGMQSGASGRDSLPGGALSSAGSLGGGQVSNLVQGSYIQADSANNTLIISAPSIVFQRLKKVIDKLDQRRAQVYVEALIAEVNTDVAAQFGIQWQKFGTAGASGTQVSGGTNFNSQAAGSNNILSVAQNPLAVGNGLNVAFDRGAITLANGTVITNLAALATFLENTSNANILSTPNLMMLDNQEAQIQIGQDIPVITGSYAPQSGSTAAPFQTFERKKVGLALRILPQVSEGGMVRLKIMQEASTVVASSLANSSGPTINTRTIETAVQVEDGGLIVLGGLIQNSLSDSVSQVPGLGDLPVVGNLFRYNAKQHTKTNLLVFLRPRTLRSNEDDQRLSAERYDYILGAQQKMNQKVRNSEAPVMPPFPAAVAPLPSTSAISGPVTKGVVQ
jgi:general secretion pathway protein D